MEQDEVRIPSREEIEQWMTKAEQGDAEAQYQLGICHANGYGVKLDMRKAVELYYNATKQGHAEAQYQLGNCYYYGYGVPLDYSKAVDYWEEAALRGNTRAQYQTGCCYENGQGVDINCKQAIYWYQQAAEQNDADAMFALSSCCRDGEESLAWCEKAAQSGNAEAQYHMGMSYEYGDMVRASFNKALYWYTRAAEQGHEEAQECKEQMEDEREEVSLWIHQSGQGDTEVLYNLAKCYEEGIGMEHDYKLAKRYYTLVYETEEREDVIDRLLDRKCYNEKMEHLDRLIQVDAWEEMAEQGDEEAMLELSKYYEYNTDSEEELNPERAVYWLRKATERGNAKAQVFLGSHYELGNVVFSDYKEAFRLYMLAAEQDDAWGQYEVGNCYERGIGTEKNIEEAIRWYAESASQDDMLSVESLERIRDYYALPEHQNLRYTSLAQAVLEKLNDKK